MLIKVVARYGLTEYFLDKENFPANPDMEGVKEALRLHFPNDSRVDDLKVKDSEAIPELGLESLTYFHFPDWAVVVIYSK